MPNPVRRFLGWSGLSNGSVEFGEECDNVTGCTDCVADYGYTCDSNANTCTTTCGDGKHVSSNEECDDNNVDDGDGCSAACTVETGWTCSSSLLVPSSCIPIWGNGLLTSPETWDDGNTDNNDGCSSLCRQQLQFGRFICTDNTSVIPNTVWTDDCGDGYNVNKDMNSNLKPGFSDYCDDGNNNDNDGWSQNWQTETYYECIGGNLVKADFWRDMWGDGMKFSNITTSTGLSTIEWDDGNLVNGDGWSDNCEVETDYFWDGGNSTNPDRCWYTLKYRVAIKRVNIRSNSFIGIELNDTVQSHDGYFTNSDIGLTLKNKKTNSDISFDWKAHYGSSTIIIIEIYPNEVLEGGNRSVLEIDFKGKVKINDLLTLIDDNYDVKLIENPTNDSIGYILGVAFHVLFVIFFIGLWVIIIADIDSFCVLNIVTAMQRLYILFLINTRLAPFLATFGVQLGLVNFKTVYFEWIFLYQIDQADIAMNRQLYNSLGWFGYSSKNIIYNSAGALSFLLIVIFTYIAYLWVFGILKLLKINGKWMNFMNKLSTFWFHIFILIQQYVQNDLTLSVFINFSDLKFSNQTVIYSSSVCLLCAFILFSLILIPIGLISSNKVKNLFTEYMLLRAGAYYSNIKFTKDSQFLHYYIVYSMAYSIIYSTILISLRTLPLYQALCMLVLNFVYMVFSFLMPYKTRSLNMFNVINHVIIFACSLLVSP